MANIKWKIQPKPTGPYRSFQHRGWPTGYTDKSYNNVAAQIVCKDDYRSGKYAGNHGPLRVRVAIKKDNSFEWRMMTGEFITLNEAKVSVEKFYNNHREKFLD